MESVSRLRKRHHRALPSGSSNFPAIIYFFFRLKRTIISNNSFNYLIALKFISFLKQINNNFHPIFLLWTKKKTNRRKILYENKGQTFITITIKTAHKLIAFLAFFLFQFVLAIAFPLVLEFAFYLMNSALPASRASSPVRGVCVFVNAKRIFIILT